ncbi:MAG: ABC transporter permease [Pseudonocardia sediminis]
MVDLAPARTPGPAPSDPGSWTPAGRRRPGSPRGGRSARLGRARLVAGAGGLAVLTLAALLVPWLGGLDEGAVDYTAIRQAPSLAHPFGTDGVGRDVLLRSFAGLWVSLQVAAACAVISTVIGTLFGAASGLLGGWPDRLLMRVVDGVNAVPHLLLGIVIVALYRGSVLAVIASIGLTHWTTVARVVRSEVLSLRRRPFVDAAISGGSSRLRILRRHLLPAVVPQAVLSAVLILPHAVWHETALSFLGLGLPPHLASLGNILGEGRQAVLLGSWWIVVFPSVLLAATTLCVAGIGAWWRDRTLPRRRSELAL